MSAGGGHLGWRSGSPYTILKIGHLRTIHAMFALNWLTGFRGDIFPIGSYAKAMSADGGDLEWRSGSLDIILKVDHLRTIQSMFALKWLTGFRGKNETFFPFWSYVKAISADGGHLGWRSGSHDIVLKVDHLRTIHAMLFFKLNYWFQRKRRRLLNIVSIGSYVKTMPSHGGHLEYSIGKQFTLLVQVHPMIIPAK